MIQGKQRNWGVLSSDRIYSPVLTSCLRRSHTLYWVRWTPANQFSRRLKTCGYYGFFTKACFEVIG